MTADVHLSLALLAQLMRVLLADGHVPSDADLGGLKPRPESDCLGAVFLSNIKYQISASNSE